MEQYLLLSIYSPVAIVRFMPRRQACFHEDSTHRAILLHSSVSFRAREDG
jgi:hypothetical protein